MAAEHTPTSAPESLPSSGAAPDKRRKGLLRERFDDAKDTALELAMDKGESWARKVANGSQGVMLDDVPKLLAALGLKIVDVNRICITPRELAEYEACKTLAASHFMPPQPKLNQDFDQ